MAFTEQEAKQYGALKGQAVHQRREVIQIILAGIGGPVATAAMLPLIQRDQPP